MTCWRCLNRPGAVIPQRLLPAAMLVDSCSAINILGIEPVSLFLMITVEDHFRIRCARHDVEAICCLDRVELTRDVRR